MDEVTERWKARAEWTAQEHFDHARDGSVPESPEYVERRRQALEDAGLEDDTPAADVPLEQQTIEMHLRRIQGNA